SRASAKTVPPAGTRRGRTCTRKLRLCAPSLQIESVVRRTGGLLLPARPCINSVLNAMSCPSPQSIRRHGRRVFRGWILTGAASLLLLAACSRQAPAPATAASRPTTPGTVDDTGMLVGQPIGAMIGRPPWIAHVNSIDLDRDG